MRYLKLNLVYTIFSNPKTKNKKVYAMNLLNLEPVYALINKTHKYSVSIYLPTFRKGSEGGQNIIRFKNLLREVEKQLQEKGMNINAAAELISKPNALLNDVDFWNHQLDGLAIFFSPDEYQYFRLPFPVEERIIINDHFHIKPMLNYMNNDTKFFIASLDLNTTKLFRCSQFSIEQVDLGNTIVRFEDYLKFNEPSTSLQNRQGAASANSPNRDASFHGYGTDIGNSARKRDIIEFFRLVDKGFKQKLKETNAPLIIAGIEYHIPLFREANSYKNTLTETINKNPQVFSLEELLQEAWAIIYKEKLNKATDALNQFGNLRAHAKATNDIKEVVKAAHSNRILHLLVNFEEEIWGKYDPDSYEVELHTQKVDGDKELVSLAVQQTLFHNGFVYPLKKEKMPNGKPLAAVFRY